MQHLEKKYTSKIVQVMKRISLNMGANTNNYAVCSLNQTSRSVRNHFDTEKCPEFNSNRRSIVRISAAADRRAQKASEHHSQKLKKSQANDYHSNNGEISLQFIVYRVRTSWC